MTLEKNSDDKMYSLNAYALKVVPILPENI